LEEKSQANRTLEVEHSLRERILAQYVEKNNYSSTELNLVVVIIICSGNTGKREKRLCQFFLWEIPSFSSISKNLILLSKYSRLECSGEGEHRSLLLTSSLTKYKIF